MKRNLPILRRFTAALDDTVIKQAAACACLVVMAGCSTFHVTSPDPNDPVARVNGWGRTASDQIFVDVTFSNPVNLGTLSAGTTIFLTTSKVPKETGTVAPLAPNKIRFISQDKFGDMINPHPDDSFRITIIGTDAGNGAVKDQSGTVLDGDNNGSPGGDFSCSFTIIG
jgi:hypothetical protein